MLLAADICLNTVKAWRIVGVALNILRILVPILIIITSVLPIFNSLIKGTAEETIKSWQQIARKIAAGIIVFLIPILIEASFKLLVGQNYENTDLSVCVDCFTKPGDPECTKHVKDFDALEEEEIKKIKQKDNGNDDSDDNDDSVIQGGSVDTSKMGTGTTN